MVARLERVLATDRGMGVLRHVDAGYDEAMSFGARHGVNSPTSVAGHAG